MINRLNIGILFAIATVFFVSTSTQVLAGEIETVTTFDASTPPGNIGIGPDGRMFLSVHEFYGQPLKLIELMKDGSVKPYPDNEWAQVPKTAGGTGLYGVLGLNVDEHGILWMLDTSGKGRAGRLIGWNTKTETLHQIIYLAAPIIEESSFLNDLAVDSKNGFIYIADTAGSDKAALIVVNLKTGAARRVLEGSKFTLAEDIDMVIDGRTISLGGAPARLGVNPITIDPSYEWLYFGSMSGTSVYRIKTADLRNAALDRATLEAKVQRYGDKPISDGITIDGGGNVYVTSITDNSIGVLRANGKYETLFKSDELSWSDGFAYGPDHKVYVTINELHRSPVLNNGKNGSKGKLKVMRFDALVKGRPGR